MLFFGLHVRSLRDEYAAWYTQRTNMPRLVCHIRVKATGYVERHFALAENDFVEIAHREGKTFVGASGYIDQLPNSNWLFQVKQVTTRSVVLRLNPNRYLSQPEIDVSLGGAAVVSGNNNEELKLHVTEIAPPLRLTNPEQEN